MSLKPLLAFVNKYEYKASDGVPEGYTLLKEVDHTDQLHCIQCGYGNVHRLDCEPWVGAYACYNHECGAFVVIYYQDRMAGIHDDVFNVYMLKKL